jgi:phospho-N-acetylmuramoyl-pentapeptide-transferase
MVTVSPLIDFLKSKYIGQYIREDGPQNHHSKKGTPTMGGVAILGGIVLTSAFVLFLSFGYSLQAGIVLFVALAFAGLGFLDDYRKVVKKHNKGVTGWTKLAVQFLLGLLLAAYVVFDQGRTTVSIFGLTEINAGYFYLIFGAIVVVASSNAINLTDGLDGLAASTCAISFLTLSYFLFKTDQLTLSLISATIMGGCIGFMVFNKYPAKIFMGDSGSLLLGGLFGTLGVLGGLELWLIPVGFIFVIETLSVIIQVISFKTTGKRLFKMAPLHHHFELSGEREPAVVLKFIIIQILFCIISVILGHMWLF